MLIKDFRILQFSMINFTWRSVKECLLSPAAEILEWPDTSSRDLGAMPLILPLLQMMTKVTVLIYST